jgi:iron complex outermembrane recepter protein
MAAACVVAIALPPRTALAEPAAREVETYMDMSLEALLRLDITSVTGAAVPWFRNPAAVYSLSSEDIRRTGHQSLAEVLRIVPGMQVSRVDSRQWAITARGFNGQFAKNLLVLTDGRLVYDPGFSGVFWDVQDMILEDVDRIEVIRGPGATLWGANAVNGVINVTMKPAKETQGLYASLGGGTEERGFGAVRYGGALGDRSHYRVWGKYLKRDATRQMGTGEAHDDWDLPHGGFRLDFDHSPATRLTLSGDLYSSSRLGESTRVPVREYPASADAPLPGVQVNGNGEARGAHLIARLERDTVSGANWSVQTYYERHHRTVFAGIVLDRDVADLDVRHRRKLGARHELMAGLAWHHVDDRSQRGQFIGQTPDDRRTETISGFLQDTIALRPERLSLMIGSKFEHNDFTGYEYQPSARLAWMPNDRHTLWAALSRAVRTPSRTDWDVEMTIGYLDPVLIATGRPSGQFLPLSITGSPAVGSESLLASEAGYRVQLGREVSIDVAGFVNEYRDLIGFPRTPVLSPSGFALPAENSGDGQGYGAELAVNWRSSARWRTMGSYSYMVAKSRTDSAPTFVRHSANLRSYLGLTRNLELNGAAYYTGKLDAGELFGAHLRADVGITFRPVRHLELALWGQDLLKARHTEFDSPYITFAPSQLERGIYAQVTFKR